MFRLIVVAIAALVAVPRAPAQVPASLSDSAFGALSSQLSEPSGFFDTDNLVSNEDSYLHAITTLQKLSVTGGAYLGVGPDQNFSYIAAVQPKIAFIIDIRRDNLLELLLYKAIFALSRNRLEYLCLLFGKTAPPDTAGWSGKGPEELLRYLDGASPDSAGALSRVRTRASRSGVMLSPADLQAIGRFHRIFIASGPGLRLTTFNRPQRADYPDFRRLMLETDLSGRRSGYLASESGFRVVKSLEDRNLVVPVVGNFAGDKAVAAVGQYVQSHGEVVAMFYTSNVEEYLIQDGVLDRFARNVERLPRRPNSVIVRSYFPYGRPHPQWVSGYLSVQLVQTMSRFLALQAGGGPSSYYDLVTRDLVDR